MKYTLYLILFFCTLSSSLAAYPSTTYACSVLMGETRVVWPAPSAEGVGTNTQIFLDGTLQGATFEGELVAEDGTRIPIVPVSELQGERLMESLIVLRPAQKLAPNTRYIATFQGSYFAPSLSPEQDGYVDLLTWSFTTGKGSSLGIEGQQASGGVCGVGVARRARTTRDDKNSSL